MKFTYIFAAIAAAGAIKVGDHVLSNNPDAQLDGGDHDSSSVSMHDDFYGNEQVMKQFKAAVEAEKKGGKKWDK